MKGILLAIILLIIICQEYYSDNIEKFTSKLKDKQILKYSDDEYKKAIKDKRFISSQKIYSVVIDKYTNIVKKYLDNINHSPDLIISFDSKNITGYKKILDHFYVNEKQLSNKSKELKYNKKDDQLYYKLSYRYIDYFFVKIISKPSMNWLKEHLKLSESMYRIVIIIGEYTEKEKNIYPIEEWGGSILINKLYRYKRQISKGLNYICPNNLKSDEIYEHPEKNCLFYVETSKTTSKWMLISSLGTGVDEFSIDSENQKKLGTPWYNHPGYRPPPEKSREGIPMVKIPRKFKDLDKNYKWWKTQIKDRVFELTGIRMDPVHDSYYKFLYEIQIKFGDVTMDDIIEQVIRDIGAKQVF